MKRKNERKSFIISVFISTFAPQIFRSMKHFLSITLTLLLLISCSDNPQLQKLNAIKAVGDKNPVKAMHMLDSLQEELEGASEYVKMKQLMLKMRLNDKADVIPTSDDDARTIIEYFDNHGTNNDKQEAHFYAGSAYRDLNDTPKALEHFLQSESMAKGKPWCDSIILRNTYSNLHAQYYIVQDYANALEMAKKEYKASADVGPLSPIPIIHLGASYLHVDSTDCAYRVFCEALDTIKHMDIKNVAQRDIYALIYDFSFLKKQAEADYCYSLITSQKFVPTPSDEVLFAEYFILKHEYDSAITCFHNVIRSNGNLLCKYDAIKNIMYLHEAHKNDSDIKNDLRKFLEITDSVDFGERQKMAAKVNNLFQYHRNQMAEQKLIDEKDQYKSWMILFGCFLLFVALSLAYYNTRKKNKHLQELLHMSSEISTLKSRNKKAKEELDALEKENAAAQARLEDKKAENKALISMLHKAELEEKAEDIVQSIKKASMGLHHMTADEWQKFYHAVDELQPGLMEKLLQHSKRFSEEQKRFYYLKSIGLTNTQIENLTGLPHVTVWRWAKKFS